MSQVVFANDEFYHVYNRSSDQRPVFVGKKECQRAILTLNYYRFKLPLLRLSKALLLETQQREKFFRNLQGGRENGRHCRLLFNAKSLPLFTKTEGE